ncbi:electron transfer flavoprotein subunit alpha/FixB family protein [Sinanaerobacter chloroacetimidivorans]|uniref:FAD-binding protein n=1 Tax=Sinanaerobacter chloroacetimidivorans TaxID=2818044 RepID=A0A8J8B3U0_9FIRM|nr:electron transfer flavoprotein subunit alpha/FixB family protein [Sinanaerobacter chloroacetimidivorans]MBR0600097.1 FAD-binding protein [Sinanaerobacter chloroacetimidivorans]
MAKIVIHQEKSMSPEETVKLCPFGAIECIEGKIEINAGCKMCKICVKQGPVGVFELVEDEPETAEFDPGNGILVYADCSEREIHPVTYELLGKAREMANKIGHPVYGILIGYEIKEKAKELLHYGVDEVFVYDNQHFQYFRIEPYAAAMEDLIMKKRPTIVLVGGTTVGRSLAPRVAARFRTGLTADCTKLSIQDNTDLDQIRPAFGGNIMAHIHTPKHRPQFATVRYKVFDAPARTKETEGKITEYDMPLEKMASNINVIKIKKKEKIEALEDAEVIVVAGRAVKKKEDLNMIYQLADRLGAQVAGTRPLIETGWLDARKQIGLSGRTVKPKLIITCGVSGAIQFISGMNNTDCIIAINSNENASIFNVAHYGIVGDIYEVIPRIIEKLK